MTICAGILGDGGWDECGIFFLSERCFFRGFSMAEIERGLRLDCRVWELRNVAGGIERVEDWFFVDFVGNFV